MLSKLKILLLIILVLLGIVAAFGIYECEQPASTNVMKGDFGFNKRINLLISYVQ